MIAVCEKQENWRKEGKLSVENDSVWFGFGVWEVLERETETIVLGLRRT